MVLLCMEEAFVWAVAANMCEEMEEWAARWPGVLEELNLDGHGGVLGITVQCLCAFTAS